VSPKMSPNPKISIERLTALKNKSITLD
jgi:hypothetical protein